MAMTPKKEAALVRVIAKASRILADADDRIGKAVWNCLLEAVGEEMGSGVPGIVETETECSRLDIGPDGHSVVYHFDLAKYAKAGGRNRR